MDNIKTYQIGNGEITLNKRDADELRYILQKDFLEYIVRNIVEYNEEAFHFSSDKNRSRFINDVTDRFDDLINIFGAFEETVSDYIFEYAEKIGVNV